jgi:carbamoyltransferase
MLTVGVNMSHHASICIKDGDKLEYHEEDRFNKIKYWSPRKTLDYKCFSKIKDFNCNMIFTSYWDESLYEEKVINFLKDEYHVKNWYFDVHEHHAQHALCGFYFSPFSEALVIVIDGGGARSNGGRTLKDKIYQECDSIYYVTKNKIDTVYKNYGSSRYIYFPEEDNFPGIIKSINKENLINEGSLWDDDREIKFSSTPNPGQLFNTLCFKIGLTDGLNAGKAMGLASYGKLEGERDEDLAQQVQEETLKYTINLIEKALNQKDCKNIILSGGYALNCVNNYKYTQKFKDYNFFIDPVAHDGGTAIGAAVWYDNYR